MWFLIINCHCLPEMRTARKAALLNSEQFHVTQASDTQFQSGVQSREFLKAVHNSPLHIQTPSSLALNISKHELSHVRTDMLIYKHSNRKSQWEKYVWKGHRKKWYKTQGAVFFYQYNSFNGNFCSMITFSHPGKEFLLFPSELLFGLNLFL